jgi:hypothetical protein
MNELKDLFGKGTAKTPEIDFNHLSGELILSGRSIPENAAKTYEPLLKWVSKYITFPRPVTNFRLQLEYFNTSSMIWLSKIIKSLCTISREDYMVFIHLYFDHNEFDDMETEDLQELLASLISTVVNIKVSVGIKAYGTKLNGEIVKESLIFI